MKLHQKVFLKAGIPRDVLQAPISCVMGVLQPASMGSNEVSKAQQGQGEVAGGSLELSRSARKPETERELKTIQSRKLFAQILTPESKATVQTK